VWHAGRDHHHLAGPHGRLAIAGGEGRLALLDDEDLGVVVAMQVRPAAGRRVEEEERDPHAAAVLVSLEGQ